MSKNRRGMCGQSNIPRKATFMAPAHLMVFRRCSWRSFSVLSGREQKTERSPLVRRRNSHGEKNRKQTANGEQGQGLATGNYRAWFQCRSTNLSRYLRFQPCSIISDQSPAVASTCSPRLCSPMSLKDDAFETSF